MTAACEMDRVNLLHRSFPIPKEIKEKVLETRLSLADNLGSFKHILNLNLNWSSTKGPRTVPCGTSDSTCTADDPAPFMTTDWGLSRFDPALHISPDTGRRGLNPSKLEVLNFSGFSTQL